MQSKESSDPNGKWRRAWRTLHSPFVLLPSSVVCASAAAHDVSQAVSRFGWLLGLAMAAFLIVGVLISVFDMVPYAVRWLRQLFAQASALLQGAGLALERLAERIAAIISDS